MPPPGCLSCRRYNIWAVRHLLRAASVRVGHFSLRASVLVPIDRHAYVGFLVMVEAIKARLDLAVAAVAKKVRLAWSLRYPRSGVANPLKGDN